MAKPEVVKAKQSPGPLLVVECWSLIRKDGGLSPVKVRLTLDTVSLEAEVESVEVMPADYRAVSQSKVLNAIANNTPTWVRP